MSVWNVKPSGGGGGGEKPPAGNHPAVLVAIIDLGTQYEQFGDQPGKWVRRAFFVWELVTQKQSGKKDANHVIGIDLTVSLHEKAKLRKWIEARSGKPVPAEGFNIAAELGQKCLVSVVLNKGGYPKVDAVASVPTGWPIPDPQNKPLMLTLDDLTAGKEIPEWVPYSYGEPVGEIVKRCQENGGTGERPTSTPAEKPAAGPIPF